MKPANKIEPVIMKFGGTSVGSTAAVLQVVEIVAEAQAEGRAVVVVASAVSGVTNRLLESAHQAAAGSAAAVHQTVQELREHHAQIADGVIENLARRMQVKQEIEHLVGTYQSLCQAIGVLGEATPRALDAVAGLGERMSVRLIAAALESAGTPAHAAIAHGSGLARYRLGELLHRTGRTEEAGRQFSDAQAIMEDLSRRRPDESVCHWQLICLLANYPDPAFRDPQRAVVLANRVLPPSAGHY